MPRYNGACEAGIGGMKRRTEIIAARHGRIAHWSCDDLFAALVWANDEHYPHGKEPLRGRPAARRRLAKHLPRCRGTMRTATLRLHRRPITYEPPITVEPCVMLSSSTTISRSPGGPFLNQFMLPPFGPLFSDMNELHSYFESVDRRLEEEIASRPANLRLPHKGSRFRTLRDTVVDVVTCFRGGDDDLLLPIEIKNGTIPQGVVVRLNYEPDPSESTHCSLVPEQYMELEMSLIDAKFRKDPEYSGFNFSVSYLQLDKDFDWLE